MIHLYAFVDELEPLPALRGAAGEPLDTHRFDGVTAVVGELAEPLPETTESAVAHGLVVESLRDYAGAVLPARLTRPFADRAALVAATSANVPSLRRRLARVRGCVEVGVRMSSRDDLAPEPAADGTAYMRRLAAAASVRAALADEAQTLLGGHALEWRVQTPSDAPTLYRAAYLVRRDDADGFARHAARLADRHPELAFACTGPWAPYSFAEEAA
jgi:Gas vesicle synthesis protein GvpL/GvpF